MTTKKYSFLVEVVSNDKEMIDFPSYWSAEKKFKEAIIRRVMKTLAEMPNLVLIDVDEYEDVEEIPHNISIYLDCGDK